MTRGEFLQRKSSMPPQIAKLIPRLASEHDGEVVATARAIERLLKGADLDWHDVAKRVEAPESIYSGYGPYKSYSRSAPPRPSPPPQPKPPQTNWSTMTRSLQTAWCVTLLRGDNLDAKTIKFLHDVQQKLHLGMDFYLAPRHKRRLSALIKAAIDAGNAARAAA